MTYLSNIKCPHCGREWIYDTNVHGHFLSNLTQQTKECRCWHCHKIYPYSIVSLGILGKTIQAPFCHICDMPMSIIKYENIETDNDHEMKFDIYEWGCVKQPHRDTNLFIGIMTTGLKYLGNTI